MKKQLVIGSLFLLGLTLLAGCGQQKTTSSTENTTKSTKVIAVGSTALQPLVEEAAKKFQTDHPKTSINVQGGGSGTGLSQVAQGAVTIGNSDIFAEASQGIDAKKLVDHQVAVVGMAPVVNPDTKVKNVSLAQLKQIFTGKITNWRELGGKDEKIVVVNRAAGSGTRATFEASVLKGAQAVKSQEQDSNGTVQQIVKSTPGAISYLAFSYFKTGIQPLAVDGVQPTAKNVATNRWQIWSYEHMYTQKKITSTTQKFIKYIQSSRFQDTIVKKLGYISIHDMEVVKDAHNQVSEK